MAAALIALSSLSFVGLCYFAWNGQIGLPAIGLLLVSAGAWFFGSRSLQQTGAGRVAQRRLSLAASFAFTVGGIMALLRHRIKVELPLDGPAADGAQTVTKMVDGQEVLHEVLYLPIYDAIASYITQVDPQTFVMWAVIAMAVKFVGVIASAYGWNLLLRGQGVRYPFWSKIMTAFLIGRFIGTFLPSTIGLDGYTLYEAGKYSNQWARVITAKALEKFIGVTGLFLGMLLTLPFGYKVLVDVAEPAGYPDAAPIVAGLIGGIAGGGSIAVVVGLIRPAIIVFVTSGTLSDSHCGCLAGSMPCAPSSRASAPSLRPWRVPRQTGHPDGRTRRQVHHPLHDVRRLLLHGLGHRRGGRTVLAHRIRVIHPGSRNTFSPRLGRRCARGRPGGHAAEGTRRRGSAAVLSGALGFIAAEAATMWGGLPAHAQARLAALHAIVDGEQVDYAWIDDSDDQGFDADRIAAERARHQAAQD